MSNKGKWTTVSLPRKLTDDVQKLIDKFGYWPSMGAFVREAAIEKLRKETQLIVPIVFDRDSKRIEMVRGLKDNGKI